MYMLDLTDSWVVRLTGRLHAFETQVSARAGANTIRSAVNADLPLGSGICVYKQFAGSGGTDAEPCQ